MGCGRAKGDAQLLRNAGTVGEKRLFDHVPRRDGGAFFQVVPEWAVLDFTDVFSAEDVVSLVLNKPFPNLRFSLGLGRFAVQRVKTLWC